MICDLFTVRKDGTKTVSAIRRGHANTPIIAMIGSAGEIADAGDLDYARYLERMGLNGATAAIAKPFRAGDLFVLVQRCLNRASP